MPTGFTAPGPPPAKLSAFETIYTNFLNIALTLGGIVAFVMLLIGGFKYLTSGGDPKQTQSAGQTITWAIVGLIVALAAWFIIRFIESFTGTDLLHFSITGASPSPAPNP